MKRDVTMVMFEEDAARQPAHHSAIRSWAGCFGWSCPIKKSSSRDHERTESEADSRVRLHFLRYDDARSCEAVSCSRSHPLSAPRLTMSWTEFFVVFRSFYQNQSLAPSEIVKVDGIPAPPLVSNE
eukprot:766583-Hanusia_phi.AAC.4